MPAASEILLFLLLDLAIIIIAARVLGGLAVRAGQPAVVGEIVAGILLGPSVLGRIVPEQQAQLFPPDVPLRQLADLGLIFFMFLVGLELDTRLIRKEGRRALAISASGVAVPLALGALLGVPLLAVNNGGVFAGGGRNPPGADRLLAVHRRGDVHHGISGARTHSGGTRAVQVAARHDRSVRGGRGRRHCVDSPGGSRWSDAHGSASETATVFLHTALFAALMLTAGRRLFGMLSRRYEATGRLTVDRPPP